MSIQERDAAVQSTRKLSPRAHFLMRDGVEIEIYVLEAKPDARAVAWAEWGGWNWRAEGDNGNIAMRNLIERLYRRDPSYSDGSDWGHSGHEVVAP
jgi:hypothetical protein